jgi:hypothetical protein
VSGRNVLGDDVSRVEGEAARYRSSSALFLERLSFCPRKVSVFILYHIIIIPSGKINKKVHVLSPCVQIIIHAVCKSLIVCQLDQ